MPNLTQSVGFSITLFTNASFNSLTFDNYVYDGGGLTISANSNLTTFHMNSLVTIVSSTTIANYQGSGVFNPLPALVTAGGTFTISANPNITEFHLDAMTNCAGFTGGASGVGNSNASLTT